VCELASERLANEDTGEGWDPEEDYGEPNPPGAPAPTATRPSETRIQKARQVLAFFWEARTKLLKRVMGAPLAVVTHNRTVEHISTLPL
jgi:hypothetical protein